MVTLTNILFGRRKSWVAERTARRRRAVHRNPGARKLVCARRPPAVRSSTALRSCTTNRLLSPATKKRRHDELEKDIDELTTDSELMSGGEDSK